MLPDPDQVATAAARARDALRAGNALLCYDIVVRAEKRGLRAPDLEYLAILALANCGSTQQALDRYHEGERSADDADQDWLALEGRLFKDLALQGGAAAHFMFERSAQSYWKAFQKTGGYFSAINAATMFMLSGDEARAQKLARDVLALTGKANASEDMERYNLLVSHAESALLLGDEERARKSLKAADALARDNVAARSRTVRQLRLICQHLKLDKNLPSHLAVPPAIYVAREQEVEAAQISDGKALVLPGEVRGARVHLGLQAPVDLCVLERFIEAGSRVSVVIPGTREDLIHNWQRQHGDAWMMRLAAGLELAQEVSATPGFLEAEPKWAQQYVAAKAFGLSRLFADQIKTRWTSFAIESSAAAPGFHLRALDKVRARESERGFADVSGPPSEMPREAGVRERRLCAVLFADFRGIQKIADPDLPRFRSLVLARLGKIVAEHGKKILLRKAWGDALHVVIADAATAAAIALEIQREILEIASREKNAFSNLELRIALHFAPAFRGDDPFEDTQTYYGSELTFAARIEPVTPPATVFVTEAFAARLVVEAPDQYRAEYAGELELAGSYGRSRLFSLRRNG